MLPENSPENYLEQPFTYPTLCPALFKQVQIINSGSANTNAIAGTIQLAAGDVVDVLVDADRQIQIVQDPSQIPANTNMIERSGILLGTGAIDLHSTSGEPGHESRETIAELVQAAKNGGFAMVGILPNTQPVIDDIAALEFWRNVQQKLWRNFAALGRNYHGGRGQTGNGYGGTSAIGNWVYRWQTLGKSIVSAPLYGISPASR